MAIARGAWVWGVGNVEVGLSDIRFLFMIVTVE